MVTKDNAIDTKMPNTSGLVNNAQYDSDKQCLEKKIEDVVKKIAVTSRLEKKTEKLKRLKVGHLVLLSWLLLLLKTRKIQRLETKELILLI